MTKEAVGGGNLLLLAETSAQRRWPPPRRRSRRSTQVAGAILPFPGGIVRSGSKIGGKYKGMIASTNDAFAPTLSGADEERRSVPTSMRCSRSSSTARPARRWPTAMQAGIGAVAALGPDSGRGAHQRRQLRRQARQVPLSSEGAAAVKRADLHADRRAAGAARPFAADRRQRLAGLDKRAMLRGSGSASASAPRRRRYFPGGWQRSRTTSSSKAAATASIGVGAGLTDGHDPRHRRCRRAGRTAAWRRPADDRGQCRPACRARRCAAAGWRFRAMPATVLAAPLAGELAGHEWRRADRARQRRRPGRRPHAARPDRGAAAAAATMPAAA